jgi:hydroxymethylpyrimidine/phosphomethylpyrimidine kinase
MQSRILTVAGSDPSGGAGLQADIKTITALGGYAMAAVTALTIQDTLKVYDVFPVPVDQVAAQITAVLNDIGADVIKTGMLCNADIIAALSNIFKNLEHPIALIVDPVIISTSGHALLSEEGARALKEKLFPFITLLTPNLAEAEELSGLQKINSLEQMEEAGKIILSQGLGNKFGGGAVLIKGGHLAGNKVSDMLLFKSGDSFDKRSFTSEKQMSRNTHGTGCTLASAIAVKYADHITTHGGSNGSIHKDALIKSVEYAHSYVQRAMKAAPNLGQGSGPLNHIAK